jgi:hypothetical protein
MAVITPISHFSLRGLQSTMPQDLSLNDVVMPKCYTRALWVFDYKIDDLEKPVIEFLNKFCPAVWSINRINI